MGARLRVFLTRARQIQPCSTSQQEMYPRKSKTRAEIIRLNAQGCYIEKIAADVNWTAQTVTEVLHKWEKLGRERLWERPRRGGKAKWKE
jgi:transposase